MKNLTYKISDKLNYYKFFSELHEHVLFDWYFEIGTFKGHSLVHSRSKSISVDPFYRAEGNMVVNKPQLLTFQTTSDEFFESGFLKKNDIKLSFSFLDGMHLFEYLLRDFINTEKHSTPHSYIALHDICPWNNKMTHRNLDNIKGAWTGDVWKVIAILQAYRPDLKIEVLPCAPTGLALISNLDPSSHILKDNYEKILGEYMDVNLESYGPDRYFNSFEFVPPRVFINRNFNQFSQIALDEEKGYAPKRHST